MKRDVARTPHPTDDFEVLSIAGDGRVEVFIRGEIDMDSASRLEQALAEVIPGAAQMVIDLHDTTFVDSAGLSVFIRAFKQLRQAGGELVLRALRPNARKVLTVTGLDGVIRVDP